MVVSLEEALVCCSILKLRCGQSSLLPRVCEVVKRVLVNLDIL